MTKSDRNKTLKNNTLLWLMAMVLPGVLSIAFASTRFPWPMLIPLLLFGCLLTSNRMLAQAIGEPTEDPAPKKRD